MTRKRLYYVTSIKCVILCEELYLSWTRTHTDEIKDTSKETPTMLVHNAANNIEQDMSLCSIVVVMKSPWLTGRLTAFGADVLLPPNAASVRNGLTFQISGKTFEYKLVPSNFTRLPYVPMSHDINLGVLKSIFEKTGWSIGIEIMGCETIWSRIHFVTWKFNFTQDIEQVKFCEKLYLRYGRVDWLGTKRMWIDWLRHPLCDLDISPHPWIWIFRSKLQLTWNEMYITWIRCWTHYVTLNFDLKHDSTLKIIWILRTHFEKLHFLNW